MSSVVQILEDLENVPEGTGSNTARLKMVQANSENVLLRRVFAMTYDPYMVFYVLKIAKPKISGPWISEEHSDKHVSTFLDSLENELATRKITGNAAKDRVKSRLDAMSPLEQKWCTRILLRNLRCGVQASTVNKVWPGTIVPFTVMLANKVKSSFVKGEGIKLLENIKYPVQIEPKLDGLRCVAIKQSGVVTLYTRNGNELDTMPSIKAYLEQFMPDDFVFDGEGLATTWNKSSSVMMSTKNSKDDKDLVLNVFDALTLEEWKAQRCYTTSCFANRRAGLEHEITKMTNVQQGPVVAVDCLVANNDEELLTYYAKCMDAGFEGIMVKDLDAVYEWDRTDAVKKLKPVAEEEGVVVGWYEGRVGTKFEGQFGGFYVMFLNGVITRVGGGYSKPDRALIQLEGPTSWLGKILQCEFQPDPLTTDGLTVDGRLRFPVYIRERDDRDVDPLKIRPGREFLGTNPMGHNALQGVV